MDTQPHTDGNADVDQYDDTNNSDMPVAPEETNKKGKRRRKRKGTAKQIQKEELAANPVGIETSKSQSDVALSELPY